MSITATIPLTFTLTTPLHHGAGTSGNSQLLRTQEIVLPDGSTAVVPFVSGNSLRHAIRAACAELTLTAVDAQPGTLTKPVVDLLYSGGALTSSDTAQIDLGVHRTLDQLWPVAGLLGYSGRGQIWSGSLYVDHIGLVCAENAWRLPKHVANHPHAVLSAASLRDEDFGTRHDAIGSPASTWVDPDLWAQSAARTTQMMFDWQVIKAGATMYGAFHLACATPAQTQVLRLAWDYLTVSGSFILGAKRAQGYGRCTVDVDWSQLPPIADVDFVGTVRADAVRLMEIFPAAAGR